MSEVARVRDWMSRRVVTFRPEMDLREAIDLLLRHKISGAPVVDRDGRLVGILSKRDCLKIAFKSSYHQEQAGPVSAYMTPDVKTVAPDDPLVSVAERFLATTFRRYPVVDGGRVVGVISRHDVLKALAALW